MAGGPSSHRERLEALAAALAAGSEEGAVQALVHALHEGVPAVRAQRRIIRAMAKDGQELHSMVYVAAAFDLAAGLGPEAGQYPMAAAALQIARQPKNSAVASQLDRAQHAVASRSRTGSLGEAERALAKALDELDGPRAIESAILLHRLSLDPGFVLSCFAKWACRPLVVVRPAGYVSHHPLQIAAAWELLKYLEAAPDTDLLLAHLAFCQTELSRRYVTDRIESAAQRREDPAQALLALRQAVLERDTAAVGPLIDAAWTRPQAIDEVGRVLMRCAVEDKGGLGHRFTLADAARRIARRVHPAIARATLHHAALSIAHGYPGAKRVMDVRDLPHPHPGGSDFAGRLLVGISSGNLPEAHAALRGLFEGGASARQIAVAVLDAASHIDSKPMRSNHPLILTQGAWRAISDGFYAGEAVPLLAELAVALAAAPKDHELIQLVEEAAADYAASA
jgi:hypothetical protein